MTKRLPTSIATRCAAATLCVAAIALSAEAFQPKPTRKVTPAHRHTPIEIVGEPIVERLRIPLQQPRRIVIDEAGNRDIADSGAGKVYRLSRNGKISTLADKLDEPSGMVRDPDGNLYVSLHAHGEPGAGSVMRISKSGKRKTIAAKLTAPKALAIDSKGTLFLALFNDNRIVTIDPKGRLVDFARDVDTPDAMVFDAKGNLLVVNAAAGTVSRIAPNGKVSIAAKGLTVPSDIVIGPNGLPLVTNYAGKHLSEIASDGTARPYLAVPQGTIGIAVNSEGNLVFLNWDLGLAVKITTRLTIPCPHCNKKIPVRIRPHVKPAKKKTKPVI